MEFEIKSTLLLLCFLFCGKLVGTDSPHKVTLYCKFHGERSYLCVVQGLENQNESSEFSKVDGDHADNKTNSDVVSFIAKNQNISFVPHNISKFFTNLSRFEVKNSLLTGVVKENLAGLAKLDTLILTNNRIRSLKADVFEDLYNLKRVELSGNELSELHHRIFTKNNQLEVLTLDKNNLKFIHEELLITLTNLQVIFLQNNAIEDLRETTFKNNYKLQNIDLSSNKLSSIGPLLLENLNSLQTFNFSNNTCVSKTYKTVDDLKEIFRDSCFPPYFKRYEDEIIDLKAANKKANETLIECQANLEAKTSSFSKNQSKLEELQQEKETADSKLEACNTSKKTCESEHEICKNDLKAKQDELTKALKNYAQCEGSKQPVETVNSILAVLKDTMNSKDIQAKSTIENLQKELKESQEKRNEMQNTINRLENDIQFSVLQLNETKKLRSSCDDEIGKLKSENNQLQVNQHLQPNFETCQNELKKCGTQLPSCNSFFMECSYELKSHLKNEYICRTKYVSACQPNMKLVGVGGNHLKGKSFRDVTAIEISDSLFHFSNDLFHHLPSIWRIKVTNSGLSTLEPKLSSNLLMKLEIEGNQFSEVPSGVFTHVRQISNVLLDNNQIEKLNVDSFAGLSSLSSLSLDRNKISDLPFGMFNELESLTHFSVKNNRLTALDGELFRMNIRLSIVVFDDNNIQFIGETLLDFSNKLKIADFRNTCAGYFDHVKDVRQSIKQKCQRINGN